jgi:hypothetical protein
VSPVHPELRVELRTALFQAMRSGKSVEARHVRLNRDGRLYFVNMTVRPFRDEDAGTDLVKLLVQSGANTMETNDAGESAVDLATASGDDGGLSMLYVSPSPFPSDDSAFVLLGAGQREGWRLLGRR